jgi:hypothetical protein
VHLSVNEFLQRHPFFTVEFFKSDTDSVTVAAEPWADVAA